jgi:hypothetical protein
MVLVHEILGLKSRSKIPERARLALSPNPKSHRRKECLKNWRASTLPTTCQQSSILLETGATVFCLRRSQFPLTKMKGGL